MKKPKKITKKKLLKLERIKIRKQFEAWAKQVKERDENKCVICGRIDLINSHHIIPREVHAFRFIIENGISVCPNHHNFSRDISCHNNPFTFYLWLMNNRPEQFKFLKEKIT